MAKCNYTALIEALKTIRKGNSESYNRRGMMQAIEIVQKSDLSQNDKTQLISTIQESANPSGWYYQNNGIEAGIEVLILKSEEVSASGSTESLVVFHMDTYDCRSIPLEGITPLPRSNQAFRFGEV